MLKNSHFQCILCQRVYSTQQSLCNHTKIKHNMTPRRTVAINANNTQTHTQKEANEANEKIQNTGNNTTNIFKCNYCDNVYKHRQSKTKHMRKCTYKKTGLSLESLQQKINELENKNIELEKEMHKLKSNNKTINNTNNTTNNGTINNIIIKYGDEDLSKVLSTDEMIKICNKKFSSIEQSIEMVHLNKLKPELQNIMINNLNNGIAYTYDGDTFIAQDKNTVIEDMIEAHLDNIEMIINQENDNNIRNKLDQNTIKKLEELRERLDDEEKFKINNKTYDNYKSYKINQIKLLIYNCIKKLKNVGRD